MILKNRVVVNKVFHTYYHGITPEEVPSLVIRDFKNATILKIMRIPLGTPSSILGKGNPTK
jgi:hypothetical protein